MEIDNMASQGMEVDSMAADLMELDNAESENMELDDIDPPSTAPTSSSDDFIMESDDHELANHKLLANMRAMESNILKARLDRAFRTQEELVIEGNLNRLFNRTDIRILLHEINWDCSLIETREGFFIINALGWWMKGIEHHGSEQLMDYFDDGDCARVIRWGSNSEETMTTIASWAESLGCDRDFWETWVSQLELNGRKIRSFRRDGVFLKHQSGFDCTLERM